LASRQRNTATTAVDTAVAAISIVMIAYLFSRRALRA
jgi:hypothetical protein